MKKSDPFSPHARLKSFAYAFAGIGFMLRTQHNAWLHAAATIGVVAAGLACEVRPEEWRWLFAAVTIVWVVEAVNTAFEHLCNVVSPQHHPEVEKAKDVAAGAVLIAALGAAAIGASIFAPYAMASL
ncbi:diacylglycerol kinase family protein [Methylocystis sp. MJC1]|uniref:diacylglycerol kinase family protein n=1 Tax=Methylocystis sp. MJC1 TaxID=2654282 RepID=UPI001FEE6814|nr:diacylglycerol kinase family protein [Methylocystis sp. MJC1]KAF2991969.1 Undecaprenol kinase [Methylocystis sp. MJC1]UZX11947.1 diacylglycerol kinase family protein [Methylocystis sp. MJC1]